MNSKFNLSEWALRHKSLVWYFMILATVAGVMSYFNLGREEDPEFTIKTMLIQAQWPGASVDEMTSQVTDRIEKKLQELESLDYTKSINAPGQATIYVNLLENTKAADVNPTWVKVRNMINDIVPNLPQGVVGPFFIDSFGDVYGNIYAFTADGLTQRQLRDYLEAARTEILAVPNVGKVDLIGAQDEVIYLEFSTRRMAALGITQQQIVETLQNQNAVVASGTLRTASESISMRVSGQFSTEDDLRKVNLRVNDRFFRLSDVATITRGYVDPQQALFRVNGEPAIGLAIGMKPGSNLLEFGEALSEKMEKVTASLPIGIGIHHVADQAVVVDEAVGGFTKALFEAIAIVLVVSFISLGARAGLVVALSIPLVLAITFVAMEYLGISLQRISLGALIIALGLLAGTLVTVFQANTHALIPLYAVGVFISFTCSQASMVKRWRTRREPGWQRGIVINGVGAVTTGVVAIVIASTKFTHGAWLILIIIPLLVATLRAIHLHYLRVAEQLALDAPHTPPLPTIRPLVIVPLPGLHQGVLPALTFARSISDHVTAVHVTDDLQEAERLKQRWEEWNPDVPLVIIESPYRSLLPPLLAYIEARRQDEPERLVTVVLAEFVPKHWWEWVLHNQTALRLKLALFFQPNTVVADVPYHLKR